MPNSDIFDRAEGYGHKDGTSTAKDTGDWRTFPEVPENDVHFESTHDRLQRSVDTKHTWEGPEDYEGTEFEDANLTRFRRYVTAEWDEDEDGNPTGALKTEGRFTSKVYTGDNKPMDIESTEASAYKRPVNAWENNVNGEGEGIDLRLTEHSGYRDADGGFVKETSDPNKVSTRSTLRPPKREQLYHADEAAPQPPDTRGAPKASNEPADVDDEVYPY